MGIFDNQQVQPVGTAVTPADPIPNQAEVTAIRGGQYANPLIQELFTSEGDSSKYDKNEQAKYQTLNNLERTLTDLQDAKINNRISRDQATQNEIVIAQKFKNDNPHLGKEIDDLIARRKNTYRAYDETTGKGDTIDQSQEETYKSLYNTAVHDLKIISPTETDRDKIDQAVKMAQDFTSSMANLDVVKKNIGLTQDKLNIISTDKSLVQADKTARETDLRIQLVENQRLGMQYTGQVVKVATQSAGTYLESARLAYNDAKNKNDVKRMQEIRQAVVDHQQASRDMIYSNPFGNFMPKDMLEQGTSGLMSKYNVVLDEFDGKIDSDIAKNKLDEITNRDAYTYLASNGNGRKLATAKMVFGDTGVTKLWANIDSTNFFTDNVLDPTTGRVDAVDSILSEDPMAKQLREKILPDSMKVVAKYSGSGDPEKDKMAIANIDSILGSLEKDKKPEDREAMQRKLTSITQFNKAMATDEAGTALMHYSDRINPKAKDMYTNILREQYNSPLFLGMRDKFMSLGDPAKFVNVVWQDGGVRIKPNENLSPEDKAKALDIINSEGMKKYLPLITDAVKADSHIHGNKDYPKKLEGMVADYFMVDPTKNLTPERIQEVASTAPVVNTQSDAENMLVNSYVDSRNAYLDVLKQKIAASSVDDARKQAVIDKIDAGDLSDPLVADPLKQWYTKHKVTPEFVQRIDAAHELQKQTSSTEPTTTPTQNTPQELPQGPTGASRVMGSVRVQGEDITLPNEASVEEFAKAEGFTPAQTEAMLQMWRESVAQKTRALTGERVKKAK